AIKRTELSPAPRGPRRQRVPRWITGKSWPGALQRWRDELFLVSGQRLQDLHVFTFSACERTARRAVRCTECPQLLLQAGSLAPKQAAQDLFCPDIGHIDLRIRINQRERRTCPWNRFAHGGR